MIDLRYGRCCLQSLREIGEQSVHIVATSPPYYGLRAYKGVAPSVWGGDPSCAHVWDARKSTRGNFCRCGAWLGHIGLEPTAEMYVQHLVLVFEEVRRVLRDDGTLWLNLGDSYATGGGSCFAPGGTKGINGDRIASGEHPLHRGNKSDLRAQGLKPKDLIGVPWLVAFALRAAGWYLRSAMPWIKRNPMPDSTTDRPGQSLEYVFLFSKSPRYFYDHEAVKVPSTGKGGGASFGKQKSDTTGSGAQSRQYDRPDYKNRNFRNADLFFKTWQGLLSDDAGDPMALVVNTKSYSGAHFAVWPEALVEPMIKAGTSERGCCPKCGAQWRRVVDSVPVPHPSPRRAGTRPEIDFKGGNQANGSASLAPDVTTIGFEPTCGCGIDDPVPCTVLDPFSGSGATLAVSSRLGRRSIGLDASTEYESMARERCAKAGSVLGNPPPFAAPTESRRCADVQPEMF